MVVLLVEATINSFAVEKPEEDLPRQWCNPPNPSCLQEYDSVYWAPVAIFLKCFMRGLHENAGMQPPGGPWS
ncbi:hypothetical protein [Bordetella pertussis]|uniref:hypothetical protein n=1 Tax=Bordetella pertussis TaxID=520 RepID=UPI0005E31354|nr:hypothetical protein [Bordetella pertussis]CFW36233.1 Uncharacterised protein [Bordetella pertussis]CPO19491.1 Uncharacterised protein [Bordetella pertussis]